MKNTHLALNVKNNATHHYVRSYFLNDEDDVNKTIFKIFSTPLNLIYKFQIFSQYLIYRYDYIQYKRFRLINSLPRPLVALIVIRSESVDPIITPIYLQLQ